MGSFEWMELQTLTGEIAAARSRLAAARSSRNPRQARALEEEIAAADARRARLIAHITTNLAGPEPSPGPATITDQDAPRLGAPVEQTPQDETDDAPQSRTSLDPDRGNGAASPAAAPKSDSIEGDRIVWDKLTPGDIARATDELGLRRAATLARHAEELKGLDGEQSEIESLAQAIDAFLRKFNRPVPQGDTAWLTEDRHPLLQAYG